MVKQKKLGSLAPPFLTAPCTAPILLGDVSRGLSDE